MDIEECKKKEFIKTAAPNKSKARSLIEISDIKEEAIKGAQLDERNINAYLPLAYDSLRETLEAICFLFGYNVTNHVCLGELLRELMPEFDYSGFDRFRYARNGINYYGKKVSLEQGSALIKKIFGMKRQMLKAAKSIGGGFA